jgi:Protein of unknown function (DUF3833)
MHPVEQPFRRQFMMDHAWMNRRQLLASAAALVATPALATATARLVLHEWFRGPTHAVGRFRNAFTGSERKLAVDLSGRWNGRTLALFEDFFYADGERDQKTWFFEHLGEGRYRGTRDDVVTPAEVTTPQPDTVRFGYTADLKLGSGVTRLDFDDTLTLRPDGTVFNKAHVSRFFIPLGDVELVFRKGRLPARLKRSGGA